MSFPRRCLDCHSRRRRESISPLPLACLRYGARLRGSSDGGPLAGWEVRWKQPSLRWVGGIGEKGKSMLRRRPGVSRVLFLLWLPWGGDGHSSRPVVAGGLQRLPGSSGGGAPDPEGSLPLRLAPGGVYHAIPVTEDPVRSYRTLSPLPDGTEALDRRFAFCGTFLRVTPTGRYPAPCPLELGLSSRALSDAGDRLTGSGEASTGPSWRRGPRCQGGGRERRDRGDYSSVFLSPSP